MVLIASIQCHHGDTGGGVPGGYNVTASDIWGEGVRWPVVKVVDQGVERRDPQADEVRSRREVGLVAHTARRIDAHEPRGQEGLEVDGQVARGTVVARNDERWTPRLRVEQRGKEVRAHARGHKDALGVATGARGVGEAGDGVVVVGVGE